MKKIKEIIVGLILGFVLVFLLALEPQKVSASNLIDLNDLQNVELQWNNNIDWESLRIFAQDNNFKTFSFLLQNCEYSSYVNEYKSLYIYFNNQNNTISYVNNNNEYTKVWDYNQFSGWKAEAYRLNNWSTPPNSVEFVAYTNDGVQTNNINPGDTAYETLIQFINNNSLLSQIYTLTYNGNGATSGTTPPIENHIAGSVELSADYNPGNLAKEGYVFLGWNTDATATTPVYEINMTSDTTVYAVWSRIEYTLSFNGNGQTTGIPPENINVASNENVKLSDIGSNTLAKAGYVFLGWNTNASATTPLTDITITSNTTVYAVWQKLNYYSLTYDGNGATSGTVPQVKNVVEGSTVDLQNYNPGNLEKTGYVFLGWNTNANATSAITNVIVNSNTTVYAVWGVELKKVNIKITCRDNVVWQGNATFSNNKIVGGVSWDSPTMTNIFFESLDSQNLTLINEKYGLNPNYTSNQLLLFFRPFSTEKDENGKYLAYINLIRLTTPKGTYAVNYTSDTSPKNINFETWLASEGLTNMLKVDSENYYFNIEVSWSLEEPLPQGVAEWGNVATIMAKIMASVTTLLNINIGFITLGNLLLIVISLSVLFFVIKVWKGGN